MWLIAFKAVTFLTFIEVLLVVWGTVMVAAVLFPLTRKSMYAASPAKNFKLAGIPIIQAAGAISGGVLRHHDRAAVAGPDSGRPAHPPVQDARRSVDTLGALVLGTGWYIGVRRYRRRQGIDISLAFQQIPIE